MSQEDVTDDMLMSLSDGELNEADATALRARIAADSVLAARFEVFEVSRQAARAVLRPLAEAHPPEKLIAAIRDFRGQDDNVIQLPRRARVFSPMGMAAAVLLAVFAGGVGGYALRGGGAEMAWSAGPAISESEFVAALSHTPAETPRAWRAGGDSGDMTILRTFRLADGETCRFFEVSGRSNVASGLACGAGGDWRVELATVEPVDETGYAAASGEALASVDAFLEARGGEELTAEQEQELISRGWRE